MPKASPDAQEVKIIDAQDYPYLNIDLDSVIIDLKKVRNQDFGDNLIKF